MTTWSSCSVTRSGVTSLTAQAQRLAGPADLGGQLRGERYPRDHQHAVVSPRESTRATTEMPGRSVTSGSWVRSSSVWIPMTGSIALQNGASLPINVRRMDRGLYIAASGMLAEQIRQDQIANDLANASTPGYKADRTSQRSFGDLLLANSATGADRRTAEHGRPGRQDRHRLLRQARP